MTRRDWLILFLITLLAGALRFYQLGETPPGPQFDEAYNAIDASQVLAGNRPLFLPANGGREVLYTYYQAALGLLTGRLDLWTLRLASALAGTLTVPAFYLTVRLLFRRDSRWLATFSALALAVNYWHIHFSHYGIRIILMPLIFCGVFGFFWLGEHLTQRRRDARRQGDKETGRQGDRETRRQGEGELSTLHNSQSTIHHSQFPVPPFSFAPWLAFVLSGLLTGLAVWNNPTGRFTPFVLIAYVLWLLWRYPARRRLDRANPLAGLLVTGAVAFLVFLPLGLEFLRYPEFFFGHASEVSIFAERVNENRTPAEMLAYNTLRVLGMFSFDGDPAWTHGVPDRPVFDWFLAIPFYIGVGWWGWRLLGKAKEQPDPDRDALFLMLAWAVTMLAPSVLSDVAPNYSRTLAAVPPVMLGAGLGLTWLVTHLAWAPRWRYALVATLATASLFIAVYDYFVRYSAYRDLYYFYDADKVDAVNWMKARGDEGYAVYLSPLWSTHATVTFLRDGRIRSLDTTQAMVLPPPGMGALYAFPAEQQGYAEAVADLWGETVQTLLDRNDRPLLHYVQVAAEQAQQWPATLAPDQTVDARFDDAPALRGLQIEPDARALRLYWQAEAPTLRYLTSFVHLLDARNQRVGQADVVPGDGAFPTTIWRGGERVAQRYQPEITDACSGGETVRVVAGWYEYAADGARRPRADAPGDSALAGQWTLPIVSMAVAAAQPQVTSAIPLGLDDFALVGHTLPVTTTEPGAPLTLDLYLQGSAQNATSPITLTLAGAQPAPLYTGPLAPDAEWADGEVICRRLHVRVPADATPGDYTLQLATADYAQPFAALSVQPSTRTFELPVVERPIEAVLGDAIRLHGANIELENGDAQGDALTVRLVWQALAPLATSEQVFVHLVGPDGALVAQSDALPAAGYGVEQWIAGEVVVDPHRLALPAALPVGRYRLVAGMYNPITGERLVAVTADGQPVADNAVELGEVNLGE
ncbi:MAG: hypothetical protein IAE81_10800 [Caldilineaceae bacterium]|nr:hypothetical protein [Caldilineaceae bacterium]